jgi:hypothetical protein
LDIEEPEEYKEWQYGNYLHNIKNQP